ncbi:hypothetical protein HYALB_00007180 [Hymenoscyphus albidus]|uniref:N-acetylgalactosaminide beta-1,3-galactosyltransferase n=1 Tax=Hymenoscyphus albidus TaxID=595503 RepID=A0A9N9LVM3_9HELO|nr:hypothetical protein HYALB_00007180 [Hymenoscyphus albidus]
MRPLSPRIKIITCLVLFHISSISLWTIHHHSLQFQRQPVELLNKAHEYLTGSPRFPVHKNDIGFIFKTGYGNQDKITAILDTFHNLQNVVLIGDYATRTGTHFKHKDLEIPVYDAIEATLRALPPQRNSTRVRSYEKLTAAIAAGDEEVAGSIARAHGWELDIMKWISGLEIGYRLLPNKKWYMLADDDTFIIEASLIKVLSQLNPQKPHYLGKGIGGKVEADRFAHGGSGIVFSGAALSRVLSNTSAAHTAALTGELGDALTTRLALANDVHLDERFSLHFNGERPRTTRIRPDRPCDPIITFHHMSTADIAEFQQKLLGVTSPVSWMVLWTLYEGRGLETFITQPFRSDCDHVGLSDTVTEHVETKEDCRRLCDKFGSDCLAWTWTAGSQTCHTNPWIVIGNEAVGKVTGVVSRGVKLLSNC